MSSSLEGKCVSVWVQNILSTKGISENMQNANSLQLWKWISVQNVQGNCV
jgi:hypothetical protein